MIFAFHGYPSLTHRLAYRRTNHHHIHLRRCKEHGEDPPEIRDWARQC